MTETLIQVGMRRIYEGAIKGTKIVDCCTDSKWNFFDTRYFIAKVEEKRDEIILHVVHSFDP